MFRSLLRRAAGPVAARIAAGAPARRAQSRPLHLHRHLYLYRRRRRSGGDRSRSGHFRPCRRLCSPLCSAKGSARFSSPIPIATIRLPRGRLQAATGAEIFGCAPHAAARELALGETNKLDAANDLDHSPDRLLADGEIFSGSGFTLRAMATPGHTMNHVCFELPEEKSLFTGDHIMAWSTSIVAPPDGVMRLYLNSLEKLRSCDHTIYWPGHGGPVTHPQRFFRALLHHRRARENSILMRSGEGTLVRFRRLSRESMKS